MNREQAAKDLKNYILSNCNIGYGDFTVWASSSCIEVVFRNKKPEKLGILSVWNNFPVAIRENMYSKEF